MNGNNTLNQLNEDINKSMQELDEWAKNCSMCKLLRQEFIKFEEKVQKLKCKDFGECGDNTGCDGFGFECAGYTNPIHFEDWERIEKLEKNIKRIISFMDTLASYFAQNNKRHIALDIRTHISRIKENT